MKLASDTLKIKILETVLSNLRPPKKRKVGVEIETIFYDKNLKRLPVNPGNSYSSSDLMSDLLLFQKNKQKKPVRLFFRAWWSIRVGILAICISS